MEKEKAIGGVVLFAVVLFGFGYFKYCYKTTEDKERDKIASGIMACQESIKRRLLSPGSAKNKNPYEIEYRKDGSKIFTKSYTDSQNGFGALIRTKWECTFDLNEINKNGESRVKAEVTF